MSQEINQAVNQLSQLPLPFLIRFASKTIRLEELSGAEEADYRNRSFSLGSCDGKTGKLYLGNIFLTDVTVKESGKKIVFSDEERISNLFHSLESGKVTIQVTIGRARIPTDRVFELSAGSQIVLDRSATEPAEIVIPEIDYVLGCGEVLTVGDAFGVRCTSVEGGFRGIHAKNNVVEAQLILGSVSLAPVELGMIEEGSIIGLETPSAPQKLTFKDGAWLGGYLQCYNPRELIKEDGLINSYPGGDTGTAVVFRFTSGQSEQRKENDSPPTTERRTEPDAFTLVPEALLSGLPRTRVLSILTRSDCAVAAWLLKVTRPETAFPLIIPVLEKMGEEMGGKFLELFTLCCPTTTPLGVKKALMKEIRNYIDDEELLRIEEQKSEMDTEEVSTEVNPVVATADYLTNLPEDEVKVILQWLEIRNSAIHEELRRYLVIFEDLRRFPIKIYVFYYSRSILMILSLLSQVMRSMWNL